MKFGSIATWQVTKTTSTWSIRLHQAKYSPIRSSDADIADLDVPGNKLIDLEGPTINSATLLTDVLKRDGLTYQHAFEIGTLSYAGRKGGRALGTKELEITATSTVQDFIDFVEDASGIQSLQLDSQNPILASENNIPGESGDLIPGGYIDRWFISVC